MQAPEYQILCHNGFITCDFNLIAAKRKFDICQIKTENLLAIEAKSSRFVSEQRRASPSSNQFATAQLRSGQAGLGSIALSPSVAVNASSSRVTVEEASDADTTFALKVTS